MTDIDNLSGRELDARIAEKAFGWRLDANQRDDDGAPFCLTPLPRFSENAGRARGAMFQLEFRHPGAELSYAGQSPFRTVVRTVSGKTYEAEDESEAVATCRVILKALEGEGPGQDPKQAEPIKGPRAVRAVSELLAAKAPQHPIAMTAFVATHTMTLQDGGTPAEELAAAKALFGHCAMLRDLPKVFEKTASKSGDAAQLAVEALGEIAKGAARATDALRTAASSSDPGVAARAKKALGELGG